MRIVVRRPAAVVIQEAKDYLASTDWYCARKVDEGTDIPAEVSAKRAEARETIRSLS